MNHDPTVPRTAGGLRSFAEFLAILVLGILLIRGFLVEAYLVPTGSMASTLLGSHREILCPSCGLVFAVGLDEQGQSPRKVCPNCGRDDFRSAEAHDGEGDRLLVQKFLYDLRPPRRWEVAVFLNPADPSEAYVKRIVGLPGESVEVRHGDLYIDGRIARKSPEQVRATRIIVHDGDHPPPDSIRYPRWVLSNSSTQMEGPDGGPDRVSWLAYRHRQPESEAAGPVRDYLAYDGPDASADHRVEDLAIRAEVEPGPGTHAILVRLGNWGDRAVVAIPLDPRRPVEVRLNGDPVPILGAAAAKSARPEPGRFVRLAASLFDRRLIVELDGRPLFDPIDLPDRPEGPPRSGDSPAIGAVGGGASLRHLKVDRDIYYTDSNGSAFPRPFGVGVPYRLGPDEYYVLGDNSPVSNDSRFWAKSPVVAAGLLVGKPFLVHVPGRAVPVPAFGGGVYWIPDFREIRYIH